MKDNALILESMEMSASRFIRLKELLRLVGLSRSTLYLNIKNGSFPPPFKIGQRAVAWRESDIVVWQKSKDVRMISSGAKN